MRIRVVVSGIVAGIVCQAALAFVFINLRFGRIVPGWFDVGYVSPYPNWVEPASVWFAFFVVFVFGWIAARWNWSQSWNSSFLSGAGSGLIAGTLAYSLVGAFQAGVEGQVEVLASLVRPVTEAEGMRILLDAVGTTALTTYGYLFLYVLGGTAAGALGELASMLDRGDAWGRPVAAQLYSLYRLHIQFALVAMIVSLVIGVVASWIVGYLRWTFEPAKKAEAVRAE
ncbi:MAG: hypothetical protein AB1750_01590 [Chloroflexota bacterium]